MLSIPVIAMASISFYAGFYHLLIYARSRYFRAHLMFAILCFTVVAYDAFCVGLYNSTSLVEGAQWQRLQLISLALFVPAFLWFVSDYTNQKPGPALYIYSAYYSLVFLVQLIDRSNLTFLMDQPSIKHIAFSGLSITYYEVAFGPFSSIQSFMGLIASASILVMGFRYYKSGHKREAMPLILATGLMYLAGFHDTLVSNGLYHFIYLMEYAYLATILMMTWSLSNTVVEAAIAKEELRKSEEWFRSLVETTSDWVWEVDANGKYTYASPKVRELLGYEPDEVLGHAPFDFMPVDESQSVGKVFQNIIQNRRVFERVENINLRKDGQLVVLETSGIPFFNEDGKLLGYRGIDRDISERKEAEIALKESEERFRSIVENALAGIFIIDDTYHFIYVNDELCHILRYPRDVLLGMDYRDILTEESRALVTDRYIRKQRGEKTPSRYEFDVTCRDGEIRHVEMNVAVVGDKTGKPRSMGQLIDITDRKRVEEQLRESIQQLQTVVNGAPIVLYSVDRHGMFTLSEGKGLAGLGTRSGEIVGQSVFDFFRDDPKSLASLQRALAGETFTTQLSFHGGAIFEASHIAMHDEVGECIGTIGLLVDITERKQMEDALRESRNLLQTVLDTIPVRVFWKDTNLDYLGCNQPFALDAGFRSPEEVIGHNDYQMGWLEQADLYRADDRQVMDSGQPKLGYEEPQTAPDGRQIWLRTNKVPLWDADGTIRGVLGTYEDITERKHAEEALRQSQRMLRTVLDQFPGVVYWKDRQSVYLGCNQASATAAGLTNPAEIVGKTDFDLAWAATEAKAYLADDRAVMESRQPRLEVIEPQHRADGSLAWLDTAKVPLMDENGNVIGVLGTSRDITEQVRTLNVLQETEFFLNRSQQVARIGSYKLDVRSGCWEGSPSLDEILGIDDAFPKDVDGWLGLIIPEDREMMRDHIQYHVLTEHQRFEKEYRILRPNDGQLRWMFGLGELEFDDAGRPTRMIGTLQDITERKMAETALQQATLIVENSPVMLFRWKAAEGWPVVLVSQNVTQFGYSPEELLDGSVMFTSIVHPDDLKQVGQETHDYTASGVDHFIQVYRIITKDGQVRWVEDRTMIERDLDGLATHYQGIVVDITDRKQAEEALRTSEERLQQAIRVSNIGIFDHDQITDSVYWSPDVRKSFGIGLNETFTLPDFTKHLYPEDLERIGLAIQQAHDPSGDGLFDVEYRFVRPDGSIRWFAAKSKTFFGGDGPAKHPVRTIGALVDITEGKRIEQERETLIEELETKNAELERFTYTVSHDLKSPLVTIKGFLGYIEQDAVTGNMERLKGDLRRISDAVEKMRLLLNDLLELSRVGRFFKPSEMIPFDELARQAIGLVEGAIREHHVTVKLQPDLPAVFGDHQRLVEVLQNLLDNASKFMGDQPDPCIEIGQHGEEDGNPIFFVKDNGIGFAPEYREHVFGLFNKLDPKTEGSGVGLALVKRIIEVHGGRIWVESEKGKGTTFYFTLAKDDQKQ